MPILSSASKPISYRVRTCSNCGLENGGDVLLCSGCGSELSCAGLSKADAVPRAPSDQGVHSTGVSPTWKQKSLGFHILEWFLVLFALYESGVLYAGYYVCLTRGSLSMDYSSEVSVWVYYFLRNVSALGILAYVLFRNSRWRQARAAHPVGREIAILEPEWSQTSKRDSRRVSIFELSLVLFVAFAGPTLHSFEVFVGHATIPDQPVIYSLTRHVHQMLRYAGALGLLSYVLSRNSHGFQNLGLRWTSRDVAVAFPLALGSGLAFALLAPMTFEVAATVSGDRPHVADVGNYIFGTSISMATVLSAILVGFFEELIVRGYLMTEVRRFTGSIVFAVLCSVAVQTSYHFYQGGPAALAHVGGFMVFAVYYAKTNRILPPILAHAALDLYALVMCALRLT